MSLPRRINTLEQIVMKRLITRKERAIFSQVFEQVTHVQFADVRCDRVSVNSAAESRSLRRRRQTRRLLANTPSLPANHVAQSKRHQLYGGSVNPAFSITASAKLTASKIPDGCDKRKQQPDAIALIDHQRLLAVAIVIDHFFRRCLPDFERIKKQRNRDCDRLRIDRSFSRKSLIVKSGFDCILQIVIEVANAEAHATTQMAVDVDRHVQRLDILRKKIVRQARRGFRTIE